MALPEKKKETRLEEYDGLWLSEKTKDYFNRLRSTMMDAIQDDKIQAKYEEIHQATALDLAPLVDEEATLKLLLWMELKKPITPKVSKVSKDQTQQAADALLNRLSSLPDFEIPDDVKALLRPTIIDWLQGYQAQLKKDWQKDWNQQERYCQSAERIDKLVQSLTKVVGTRARLISPLDMERYAAQRMEEDAYLTDLLFRYLKDDLRKFWRAVKDLNQHWGRIAIQTNKDEITRHAIAVGQLREGEDLDDDPPIYRNNVREGDGG